MSTALAKIEPMDLDGYGPAMRALANDRMRRFVLIWVETGGTQHDVAKAAGYGTEELTRNSLRVAGHNLYHREDVQAAILEQLQKVVRNAAPSALRVVTEIANNPQVQPRDRLSAAKLILERSGLSAITEHKVTVTKSPQEIDNRLAALLAKAGLSEEAREKLLGKVIDVVSEEVLADEPEEKEPLKYRRGSEEHAEYMRGVRAAAEAARADPALADIL